MDEIFTISSLGTLEPTRSGSLDFSRVLADSGGDGDGTGGEGPGDSKDDQGDSKDDQGDSKDDQGDSKDDQGDSKDDQGDSKDDDENAPGRDPASLEFGTVDIPSGNWDTGPAIADPGVASPGGQENDPLGQTAGGPQNDPLGQTASGPQSGDPFVNNNQPNPNGPAPLPFPGSGEGPTLRADDGRSVDPLHERMEQDRQGAEFAAEGAKAGADYLRDKGTEAALAATIAALFKVSESVAGKYAAAVNFGFGIELGLFESEDTAEPALDEKPSAASGISERVPFEVFQ